MIQQLTRALYLVISLGVSASAHLIVRTVLEYKDGRSQQALLIWFRAVRLYGLLLTVNMAINIIHGAPTPWSIWFPIAGAGYLLWALIRFLRVVH